MEAGEKGTAVAFQERAENALEFPYPRTKEKLVPAVATEVHMGSER